MRINSIVIFHQRGNNRRIGNSIKWVGPALAWCDKNNFEFFFPKAGVVFDGVLHEYSKIFQSPESLQDSILFSQNLLLNNRSIIDQFLSRCVTTAREVQAATGEKDRFISLIPRKLGILENCVEINWDQERLLSFIKAHEITIINEPFPFNVPNNNIGKLKKQNMLPSCTAVAFEKRARELNKIMIGVHIRQTDYKKHAGGKYYKDSDFYSAVISGVTEKLEINCQYSISHDGEFLPADSLLNQVNSLSSNIKLSAGQENNVTDDFLGFLVCDYLIGVESTFTRQAMELGWLWFSRPARMIVIQPNDSVGDVIEKVVEEIMADKKHDVDYIRAIENKINRGIPPQSGEDPLF